MDFELWLNKLADFLVVAGVPPEQGQIAALGLVFLCMTLLSLLIVLLLLRRNFRSKDAQIEIAEEPVSEEPVAEETEAIDEETELATEAELVAEEPVSSQVEVEAVPVAEPLRAPTELPADAEPVNLFQRMQQGLAKTRSSLVGRMDTLLGSHTRLDDEFLEELEEILITADFGMRATQELVQALTGRLKEIDQNEPGQLHKVIGEEIRARLKTSETEWPVPESGPLVILVVGVNGVGKTTRIGEMA